VVEDFVKQGLHCSIKIKGSVFHLEQRKMENWKCICKIERGKNFSISLLDWKAHYVKNWKRQKFCGGVT